MKWIERAPFPLGRKEMINDLGLCRPPAVGEQIDT